mmetsp:Transcript_84239/g.186965  ORF Transcript_84239/g.186965 Transcript_84239/m.186965 type:complete len:275 (+) Transcript_84239:20-844(+)
MPHRELRPCDVYRRILQIGSPATHPSLILPLLRSDHGAVDCALEAQLLATNVQRDFLVPIEPNASRGEPLDGHLHLPPAYLHREALRLGHELLAGHDVGLPRQGAQPWLLRLSAFLLIWPGPLLARPARASIRRSLLLRTARPALLASLRRWSFSCRLCRHLLVGLRRSLLLLCALLSLRLESLDLCGGEPLDGISSRIHTPRWQVEALLQLGPNLLHRGLREVAASQNRFDLELQNLLRGRGPFYCRLRCHRHEMPRRGGGMGRREEECWIRA